MNSSEPCEWCKRTSSQIDSLEYENEQVKKELECFKELADGRLGTLRYLIGVNAQIGETIEQLKAPELFEGTTEALDKLTIRSK